MNKFKKLTALLLSALMILTVFASCGSNSGKSSEGGQTVIPQQDPAYHYDGTHIYNATDTDMYLVKNGTTEYKLVIPTNYSAAIRTARSEFIDLFSDATGITLQVVTDDTITSASEGKFISLGRTKLLEESGIVVDYGTLTSDGHRIVTKGDDVYLCGGADEGTVFAVYTFMKLTFNYETYFYDCKEIENTREKKLKNFDVTDIPDFKFRAHSSDATTYDSTDYDENMYAWRLGYYGKDGNRGYYWMPVNEYVNSEDFPNGKYSASTNVRRWFPEWMYKDVENYPESYHPKWFSDNGGEQVCFCAHGDAAEYEAMVETAFRKVESHLKYFTPDKYPRYKVMTLTHMDNRNYCTCSKCAELSSYYGDSQAAVQILFMNDLAERVDALLEANKDKDWYREDFKLLMFAYNHNFTAPARYDAVSKKYVPIDEKVVLHDRVIAWFAREGSGQRAFDDPVNTNLVTTLAGWAACADHIYYWNYGTNFGNYMLPLDTWQYATPEMYAYFCNYSDDFWFNQHQDHCPSSNTAWTNLKVYLDAKLSWNTSLNEEELIDKWMKAMYKDAAPIMKKLFLAERAYQRNVLIDEYGLESNGDGRVNSLLVEYWPIGLLEGWLDEIDKAKAAVERYKITDPVLYETICKHIEVEAMSYIYIILETQGYTISSEKRAEYINRIKDDLAYPDFANMVITSKQTVAAWIDGLM